MGIYSPSMHLPLKKDHSSNHMENKLKEGYTKARVTQSRDS